MKPKNRKSRRRNHFGMDEPGTLALNLNIHERGSQMHLPTLRRAYRFLQ